MILQGKDIGVKPIKCENREGCTKLQKLHNELNDYLYTYSYRWMTTPVVQHLMSNIERVCKSISQENFGERAYNKQEEILSKGREIYRNLRSYLGTLAYDQEDIAKMQKFINYQMHKLIELKKNKSLKAGEGSVEDYYGGLKYVWDEINETLDNFPYIDSINLGNIVDMTDELKGLVVADIVAFSTKLMRTQTKYNYDKIR